MNKPLYTGQPLQANEYLLKLYKDKGFLTKLTQKGVLPKAFDEWPRIYGVPKPEVYIHTEVPKSGWKLISWRIGKSQEWATIMHPEGFTLEIYLSNFLEIVQNNTINRGFILGDFYWEDHKLKR